MGNRADPRSATPFTVAAGKYSESPTAVSSNRPTLGHSHPIALSILTLGSALQTRQNARGPSSVAFPPGNAERPQTRALSSPPSTYPRRPLCGSPANVAVLPQCRSMRAHRFLRTRWRGAKNRNEWRKSSRTFDRRRSAPPPHTDSAHTRSPPDRRRFARCTRRHVAGRGRASRVARLSAAQVQRSARASHP